MISGCSPKLISIYCEPQKTRLYVDDEYVGQGIVKYTIPPDRDYITISYEKDGLIYKYRTYSTKNMDKTINIYLSDDIRY